MFDDRLQDIIMEEMMEQFGPDVRTDEGSLAYNACAKIAEKLEEVYGDMDEISDNMLPDTQDDQHLIDYGEERGVPYRYAAAPVVKGLFRQEIDIGERFNCGDYTYEVIEQISGYEYKLQCDTEGVEANTNLGELEPEDYVDEYQGGEITEVLIPGTEDEDIEEYRGKVINTFKSMAFGGNKSDYRTFVNDMAGVGGCKPKRRQKDSPWINIYVISADYGTVSESLIEDIQTAIDPEENSGEGDGMAPICHHVKICGVLSQAVDIDTVITFDTGYSGETSQTQIETAIDDYLLSLRESWESREWEDTVVRLSQIEARIVAVEGVLDVTGTKINGSSSNMLLDYKTIPLRGDVVIHV